MSSTEHAAAFIMKQTFRISLLLMVVGIIFAALKTNSASSKTQLISGWRAPDSDSFFYAATALVLMTPLIVSLCAGILFAFKKQLKMVLVSFLLFTVLGASIAVHIFNIFTA